MPEHNGHRSWNAWNVSLWIGGDEGLYQTAVSLAREHGIGAGAIELARALDGCRTPDGATYNKTCIREAMRGII